MRWMKNLQDNPFTTSLDNTRNFLNKLQSESIPGIDSEILRGMDIEKGRIHAEIDRLRARTDMLKQELESIWSDCAEAAYELTSVFIHRGSTPSWGHYFFYSRHLPEAPDSWFKYNDSDVTVVSKEEVLADTTGSTANPYLVSLPASRLLMFGSHLIYHTARLRTQRCRCSWHGQSIWRSKHGGRLDCYTIDIFEILLHLYIIPCLITDQ